jgi:glycosyltransferase involved in cell wall biosynthesis
VHVLQVNKFLFGKGGSETVMFRTADLLRANDHNVSFFAMQDPQNVACAESKYFPRGRYYGADHGLVQRVRDAGASIYSVEARRAMGRLLRDRRPDVAHLHNVYHQLTLSIIKELKAQDVPVVLTLHDYKPVCPSYVVYTDNMPCHRCVGSHPGHAIVHKCVKGSRTASAIAAAEAIVVRAQGLYGLVDGFIAPSRHMASVMVDGGLPSGRMHVIPNFIADEQFRDRLPRKRRAPMVLFVGRLEVVKGVRVLLSAARSVSSDIEVVIVGHGPLEREVQTAADEGVVRYLGSREWDEIAALMDQARAIVVPSLWEENCPMVVLEAGARHCAVVASDRGGLLDLVDHEADGLVFPAGDPEALAAAMNRVGTDEPLAIRLGDARYSRTLKENAAAVHLPALLAAYRNASSQSTSS